MAEGKKTNKDSGSGVDLLDKEKAKNNSDKEKSNIILRKFKSLFD